MLENGEFDCNSVDWGATCSAKCDIGFELNGAETITCGDTGEFSKKSEDETTRCDRIRCENLKKPENGEFKIDSGAEYANSIAVLSCDDGFSLWDENGTKNSKIRCQENGTWDKILDAVCYETPSCPEPSKKNWRCALNNKNRINYCVTTCQVEESGRRALFQRDRATMEYRKIEETEKNTRCTKKTWDSGIFYGKHHIENFSKRVIFKDHKNIAGINNSSFSSFLNLFSYHFS